MCNIVLDSGNHIYSICFQLFPGHEINDKVLGLLLILLLDRSQYTYGVRIVGRRCYTPCAESKETLDSVPIWLKFATFFSLSLSRTGRLTPSPPSITPPSNTILVRLCRLCHRLPFPRHIYFRLLPPLHTHPCPQCPLRRLT